MATNRLYLVNTKTNEHVCIAKGDYFEWHLGNIDVLKKFLDDVEWDSNVILGTENDQEFFEQHLNGKNVNTGGWKYYGEDKSKVVLDAYIKHINETLTI